MACLSSLSTQLLNIDSSYSLHTVSQTTVRYLIFFTWFGKRCFNFTFIQTQVAVDDMLINPFTPTE
jgi:hypothetical protein